MERLNFYHEGNLLKYAAKRKMFCYKSTLGCSETTLQLRGESTSLYSGTTCSETTGHHLRI